MLDKIKKKYEEINGKSEEMESMQIILIAVACIIGTIMITKLIEYIMVV